MARDSRVMGSNPGTFRQPLTFFSVHFASFFIIRQTVLPDRESFYYFFVYFGVKGWLEVPGFEPMTRRSSAKCQKMIKWFLSRTKGYLIKFIFPKVLQKNEWFSCFSLNGFSRKKNPMNDTILTRDHRLFYLTIIQTIMVIYLIHP